MNNEKTNEELKQELIEMLFTTGRLNGLYMGKSSKSKLNPLKVFIKNKLYKSFILQQHNGFADDLYSEMFVNLCNIPADRFVELYYQSTIPGTNLIRYALGILHFKGFAKGRNNPNHSLVGKLKFTSSFDSSNYSIQPMENNSDDDESDNLIIYDLDEETEFEADYGMTVEEVIDMMTTEERFVFYKLLGKQKKGAKSKADLAEKANFIVSLKEIKKRIEFKKGLNDD
jgi:hypothetical protein